MRMSLIHLVLASLIADTVVCTSKVKGPPMAERGQDRQVAREGEEVKLKCPIQGYPAPMVEWSRGEEVIDLSWTRFRANKKNLKIKGVGKDDRGMYKCKGINGFGSTEVMLELLVVGTEELKGLGLDDLDQLQSPAFIREDSAEVVQGEGEEAVLDCSVTGYPDPTIVWYREGRVLREGGSRLVIPAIGRAGAARYSCRASNLVGSVERQFSVLMATPTATPTNLSVEEGTSATLDCRVEAAVMPSIRWLKKLAGVEDGALSVGQDFYRMIETELPTVMVAPGEFLSQLVVREAGIQDTGMYICFVTSPRGRFNFQPSFLTVRRSNVSPVTEDTPILILVICISIVITLLLIGAAACLVQRRQKPVASPPASVTSSSAERPIVKRPERCIGQAMASDRQAGRLEELLCQAQPPEQRFYRPSNFGEGDYRSQEYHGYRGLEPVQEYQGDFRVYGEDTEYRLFGGQEQGQNLYEVPTVPRSHHSYRTNTYSSRR